MPPNNANNASSQQSRRSNARQSKVAIPLPLSRQRPARPVPTPSANPTPVTLENGDTQERSGSQHAKEILPQESSEIRDGKDSEEAVSVTNRTAVSLQGEAGEETLLDPSEGPGVSRDGGFEATSDGSASETMQAASTRPSTINITNPPTPTSSHTSRKPTSIRTELPPAFVPAYTQKDASSSAESMQHSIPPADLFNRGHGLRPSINGIVFGGEDSSGSSPAPPLSAGSGFVPPSSLPPPSHLPPFLPPTHAHRLSESHTGPLYPAPYQYPAQNHSRFNSYESPARSQQLNGYTSHSRSDTPGSSSTNDQFRSGDEARSSMGYDGSRLVKPTFGENMVTVNGFSGMHQTPPFSRHMSQPSQTSPQDFRSEFDNAQALRDHLRSHFEDPALADCHLQITIDSDGSRQYLDGHRVILARSPALLELIRSSLPPASASLKTQLHVRPSGRHIGMNAFSDALRYLYGGALLPFEHQFGQHDGVTSNRDRMTYALQYIAAGAWLKTTAIAMRGVEVASSLLHWDTIIPAIDFALDGGLNRRWLTGDGGEQYTAELNSTVQPSQSPTYDPHSTQLLQNILGFTVNMFPPNFYPDTSAPQLACLPRLPTPAPSHQSRPSNSDPRLSKIRFGEIPVEDSTRPSVITTTISSLLFSLPFALLKFLLEHPVLADRLGMETVASIMRQVVVEREARRTKAVQAGHSFDNQTPADTELLDSFQWEESVELSRQHRAGHRLVRRRVQGQTSS